MAKKKVAPASPKSKKGDTKGDAAKATSGIKGSGEAAVAQKPQAVSLKELAAATHFNETEVGQLALRFTALDSDGSGTLTAEVALQPQPQPQP